MTADYTVPNAPFIPDGYKWAGLFRRVYLGTYYPPFRTKILKVKAAAADRGAEYWSEFGYRPMALQTELRVKYLQGKGGRAAPAGLSGHQYGLADDSTADASTRVPGLQPTWAPQMYEILGQEASKEGLIWGKSFGDLPHVQWPGFVNGTELGILLALWKGFPVTDSEDSKLLKVWAFLDAQTK